MIVRDIYLLRRSDEFCLEPGEEASIDLSLEKAKPLPCTKLYGQVVSGCNPIPGATVKILDKNFTPLCHTETNKDGHFSFINALVPGVYEIIAVADGYLVSKSRLISLKPLKPLDITIKLKPDKYAEMGTVYGIVRDGMNAPLPGVQVYIFNSNDVECPAAITNTNIDGEYLVYGLKPGEYSISAFLVGYILPKDIEFSLSRKEISCADFYLYRDEAALKGTISGKVVYKGMPVPFAMTALYLVKNDTCSLIQIEQANNEGEYLFSGLSPGNYIVKAKLEAEYLFLCNNVVL